MKVTRRQIRKLIREAIISEIHDAWADDDYGHESALHRDEEYDEEHGHGSWAHSDEMHMDDLKGDAHYDHDDERDWLRSHLKEDKSGKGACPPSGCIKKSGDKWRIISNKTGKLWPQKYKSRKSADAALDAYHASK